MSDPDWSWHCGDEWRQHVLAVTGRDVCDVVGPSPRRPRDWAAMMRRLGVRDLGGVVSAVHGPSIATLTAQRGDVVRRGWALGICQGDLAVFYGGVTVPMKDVDEAWQPQRGGAHPCAQLLGNQERTCVPDACA